MKTANRWRVTCINRATNTRYYDEIEECHGMGYKDFAGEYGRCIGKVYADRKRPVSDDPTSPAHRLVPEPIGWVFVGSDRYTDTGERFTRETWVSR